MKSETYLAHYQLDIEGMTCGHCSARVEKALRGVAGVQDVVVSLENKNARVVADETVLADTLRQAVEAQDYTVIRVATL